MVCGALLTYCCRNSQGNAKYRFLDKPTHQKNIGPFTMWVVLRPYGKGTYRQVGSFFQTRQQALNQVMKTKMPEQRISLLDPLETATIATSNVSTPHVPWKWPHRSTVDTSKGHV